MINQQRLNPKNEFKTGNHVITGCGSLDLLNKIVGNCNKDKFNTPKSFYFYSSSDYIETTVYICKRSGGKLSGIRLYLTPKRIPLIGMVKVKVKREIIGSDSLYCTAGSGSSYADSDLRSGLSPEEALRSAIQFDNYTGGGIQEVSL